MRQGPEGSVTAEVKEGHFVAENSNAASGGRVAGSRNPFAAIVTFIREVFAELSKVVTPTRRELINYTIVVLIFVVLMMLFIFGMDALSAWVMANVFGDGVLL